MNKLILLSFLIFASMYSLQGSHLVGGDMTYECLGNNQYLIRLNVYKDCNATGPTVADFDDPAFISVYEGSNEISTDLIFLQTRTDIPPVINNPCLQAPPDVCVEEGVYEFTVSLPGNSAGYTVVYQRCCRNQTIVNLNQPQNQGATFSVDIPAAGTVNCNSSPVFNDFPPIAICANEALVFDHSAVDPDGDNIVYELCAPFQGGSQATPMPNPPAGPPFTNVQYQNNYFANAPLDAAPQLSINPNTGELTGTPNAIGQYVVGVCANEYRNGNLIGTTRRDFQFNVTDCRSNVTAAIPVIDTDPVASMGTDGVFTYECQDFTVNFINNSSNGITYDWDFGVPGTNLDRSTDFEPSYTFPDTGSYVVKLVVNKGTTCADSTEVVVRIYPVFATDFDFTDVCQNVEADFLDQTQSSYGNINFWQWNFGDGNTSNQENPSHNYSSPGNYTVTLQSRNDKGCRDEIQQEITIFESPDASFDFGPTCIDQAVEFTNSTDVNTVASLNWTFSNGQSSNQPNTQQTFNTLGNNSALLIIENPNGCIDSSLQTFTVNPLPTVTTSPDTSICEGDAVRLEASGGVEYQWLTNVNLSAPNQASTLASPLSSTNYIVLVTDANECSNTDSVFITVFPKPNTSAGNDTFVCSGDSITLEASGGVSFEWAPIDLFNDPTEIRPTIFTDSSLNIILSSLSDQGCRNSDTIFLEVQREITPPDEIDNSSVCFGDTLFFNIPFEKYIDWKPNDLFQPPNSNNTFFVGSESSSVQLNMSNDCYSDSFFFDITVNPLPEVVTNPKIDTIFRDESTIIDVEGAETYVWSPEEGILSDSRSFVEVSPFNTTVYTVIGENAFGCKAEDSTRIIVEVKTLIVVPSAFSPNNDGLNDFFRIIRMLNIESINSFEIFNRWGQRVFESRRNSLVGWDGNYNGTPQDFGVYVYKISATTKDGDDIVKAGNITLVR